MLDRFFGRRHGDPSNVPPEVLDIVRSRIARWTGSRSVDDWLHVSIPALGDNSIVRLLETPAGRKKVKDYLFKMDDFAGIQDFPNEDMSIPKPGDRGYDPNQAGHA